MTWSLVARDSSGALGVAVASKFFAVGALCPAVRNGKGALSTQALINPLYARDAIAALDEGLAPEEIVRRLTAADTGRDVRQFHVIDAAGHSAAHTGRSCIDWCGHRSGAGYSLAGNMLHHARPAAEPSIADVEVLDEVLDSQDRGHAAPRSSGPASPTR